MENKLTVQMIKDAVELLKKHEVKGAYILRIHPSRVDEAYDLGLVPFCPLTDDNFIECEYPPNAEVTGDPPHETNKE